ncbi:MAG: 2-succinyl-5-enolpyruvyl-6-hydroxy-3-cyclohexene-1-carboxylic-acid synthase [Lentisphaeria bacterium]|nr:2-succinyl-5-enolpyruvyl-6-hydroxy-3-cyclohexene-1-carboxylic-acid synthase [Candidatus Neomarinimicrobiota bacterium]MCF7841995.1 2-succinyl-5-enolpyruvyl-6-hydroxy-3-cyclohexene-1-carboxylic-acid synthase [Lentisphaeria bacterium]
MTDSRNLNHANTNSLWSSIMIEALVRHGITQFVISPGSRSTPLTLAAAEHPQTRTTIHIDERGAAWFAIGYARATGKPAALICTSGTAAANYLSAIVEASQDNLPLLALTADRPPYLWNTGANQTILQSGIYSHYTRFERTLPIPSRMIPLQYLIDTLEEAAGKLFSSTTCGPVHLNCPFEKPLESTPSDTDFTAWLAPIGSWLDSAPKTFAKAEGTESVTTDALNHIVGKVIHATHGLLVLGRENDRAETDVYLKLGELLQWPVYVDIQSPVRGLLDAGKLCRITDDIFTHPEILQRWQPNVVLHLGGTLTSPTALDAIQTSQPRDYIHIHPWSRSLDPTGAVTQHIQAVPRHFAQALIQRLSGRELTPSYFENKWCETTTRVVEAQFNQVVSSDIFEAAAAYHLSQWLPAGALVFVGNSMPIRDFDRYGYFGKGVQVFGNRGASGIDGNIATLAGLAAGSRQSVIGVIGDLAALHDLNSLHLMARCEFPVRLVIINNHGGGIFSHLPIAQHENVFEPYFGTPHRYDFQLPARQYGLDYHLIRDPGELNHLADLIKLNHSAIIEIQTKRELQVGFRHQLSRQIREALDEGFSS